MTSWTERGTKVTGGAVMAPAQAQGQWDRIIL
jgi:hypothetical protein